MAWNDTHAAGTRWGSAGFLNMFVGAINERTTPAGLVAYIPTIAAGDVIGRVLATAPSGSPGDPGYAFSVKFFQTRVEAILGNFAATQRWTGAAYAAQSFDNTNREPVSWSWVSAGAGGSHPNIQDFVLSGHGWTRKYPREYADAAATTYTDGGTFTNGHSARRIDNGRVYTRTAGAWVIASSTTPPDVVTAYGQQQAGDYIGSWIWNELRDVLNVLIWKAKVVTYTRQYYSADGGGKSTAALTKADADTNWATPFTGGSSPNASARYSWVRQDNTGGPFAFDSRIVVRREALNCTASSLVASSVDFYIGSSVPDFGTTRVFDANGDDVIEDKFSLFSTIANAAAGSAVSGWTASTAQPAWPATDPDPDESVSRGWLRNIPTGATVEGFAIERFTGFTYLP